MVRNEKRVTLLDVAKEAGVSRATASLVVRGSKTISLPTQKKVEEAMSRLGYIYDRAAANLRSHRSNTVGMIINDIGNPYFADLLEGAQQKLEEYKYNVIVGSSFNSGSRQNNLFNMMLENKVCGLILFPVQKTAPSRIVRLKNQGLPIVIGGREISEADFDYVGTDNFYGISQAVKRLVDLGHKKIAFVGSANNEIPHQERLHSFLSSLQAHGITPNMDWIKTAIPTREKSYEKTGEFFTNKLDFPTGIICYNDTMAFGVMRRLWDEGYAPGEEVAVIGFDGVREGTTYHPRLTSVSQNGYLIGQESADLLHERIQGLAGPSKKVIFKPELIIRESSEVWIKE